MGFFDTLLETGAILSGENFAPAQLYASLDDGSVAMVQVGNWTPLSLPNLPVMDTYLVTNPSTGDSICGLDSGGNLVYAAPMTSTFDPTSGARTSINGLFTFACRYAALQKCNEYGDPDWISRQETYGSTATRPVNNYHDACVRMVRADYCGDGLTHTYDGTTIDIYDNLNFNAKETSDIGSDGFYFEAEWATDGAWCINKTRWMPSVLPQSLTQNRSLVNPDWTYIQTHCPERIAGNPWPNNPSGNSAPRPCGSLSSYNASVGFSMDQSKRSLLRNNSKLYQY